MKDLKTYLTECEASLTGYLTECEAPLQSLQGYIHEALISPDEAIEKLADESKPEIWDDTMSFKLLDEIEEYQNVHGEWDDSIREAGKVIDGKAVLGWLSEKDEEDLMKKLPKKVANAIKNEGKEIYKKGSSVVKLWETKLDGHDASIVTFPGVRNDSGTEYQQWWCCIGVE